MLVLFVPEMYNYYMLESLAPRRRRNDRQEA